MGFRLSRWDEKILHFAQLFEDRMMNLEINISLEDALDDGWRILAECFEPQEVGIKQTLVDKYWPKMGVEK
jgi:V/A-type H+-transporting ATPase subunit B